MKYMSFIGSNETNPFMKELMLNQEFVSLSSVYKDQMIRFIQTYFGSEMFLFEGNQYFMFTFTFFVDNCIMIGIAFVYVMLIS